MTNFLKTLLAMTLQWLLGRIFGAIAGYVEQRRREEAIKKKIKKKIDKLEKAKTEKEIDDAAEDIARSSF